SLTAPLRTLRSDERTCRTERPIDAVARPCSNSHLIHRRSGRTKMSRITRWCSIAGILLCAQGLAFAQAPTAYPDRPVRLVIAFPPGGATDTRTRQITQELGEALGQSIVIENKPGAGGYIAWNYVAGADPDGYTLLMAENALGISQALYKKHPSNFDPLRQYDA